MKRAVILIVVCAANANAQPAPPDYGFNFITIGDVGNVAFAGNPLTDEQQFIGHGSVGYEYRISQTEIRTSDWLEFVLAARELRVPVDTTLGARQWGARLALDPDTGNETYVQISPESGDWPVAGTTWWGAALYCNWLHNGKAESVDAFLSGAYDVSTFGYNPDTGNYTDQVTRSPGAKFWIPSVDEWLKAAHYDPNKEGPGERGWWQYPNGSDTKPITGVPGVGETNADLFDELGYDAWEIPVGSYPETQSPWGLLDVSGGASEWAEDWLYPDDPYDRVADGTSINTSIPPGFDPDLIGQGYISDRPDFSRGFIGLRLASAVPAPSVGMVMLACGGFISTRRRR